MKTEEKKQGRIFSNELLESFTKSNPATTILFYTCLILFFFVLNNRYTHNSFSVSALLYATGLFAWTLMEYILHRFIFHIDKYIPTLKRFHYIVHGVHHENPRDHERLFMPPIPGMLIAAVLFLFWYMFLGLNAFAFMAGVSNGYLMYSYIHYSVHTKPVFHPMHKLWKHHLLHHYKFHDKAFGVSSPLWDYVFNTMPLKKEIKKTK